MPSAAFAFRSASVAAMTLTWTLRGLDAPTGWISPVWRTRSRATWISAGASPISSRNSVPSSASCNPASLVALARLADQVRGGEWDNESDENVIEQVTLTYDFFELVQ